MLNAILHVVVFIVEVNDYLDFAELELFLGKQYSDLHSMITGERSCKKRLLQKRMRTTRLSSMSLFKFVWSGGFWAKRMGFVCLWRCLNCVQAFVVAHLDVIQARNHQWKKSWYASKHFVHSTSGSRMDSFFILLLLFGD